MGAETKLTAELLAALRGEALPSEEWRKRFGTVPPHTGGGSHNHPALSNAVGAVLGETGAHAVWEATAASYAEHGLFGNEAGSRNAYARFNAISLMAACEALGRPEWLRVHVRAFWTLLSVTAAPADAKYGGAEGYLDGPEKEWYGSACVMTGARSWVRAKPRTPADPFIHIEKNQLDLMVDWGLFRTIEDVGWWQDCARQLAFDAYLTLNEQSTLQDVQVGIKESAQVALAWLSRFPRSVTIRRYTDDLLMVCHESWNSGSTSFCYAVRFNEQTRRLTALGTDNGKRSSPNTHAGDAAIVDADSPPVVVAFARNDPSLTAKLELPPIAELEWELHFDHQTNAWELAGAEAPAPPVEPPVPEPPTPEPPAPTPPPPPPVNVPDLRKARNRCHQIALGNPPISAVQRLAGEARDLIDGVLEGLA